MQPEITLDNRWLLDTIPKSDYHTYCEYAKFNGYKIIKIDTNRHDETQYDLVLEKIKDLPQNRFFTYVRRV